MGCMCGLAGASIGLIFNLTSLYYAPVSSDLNFLLGSFSFHYTIMMTTLAFFSLFIPGIFHQFGFKRSLIFGVTLASGSTFLMAFSTHLLTFYLLAIMKGVGTAFFANVPLTNVINNWFDRRNGLALSLTFASGGLVGIIFSPLLSYVINQFSWQVGFITKAVLIIIFTLPAIIVRFEEDPRKQGLQAYGNFYSEKLSDLSLKNKSKGPKKSRVLSPTFFSLFLFAIFQSALIGVTGQIPGIGLSFGFSTQMAALMVSVVMAGNLFFKLTMGQLTDRFGINLSTLLLIIINIIGSIFFLIFDHPELVLVSSFLFSSIYGVVAVSYAVFSKKFFGKAEANRIFPLISMASNLGKAFAVTGVGFIFDFTGSYDLSFIFAIIFQVICIILLFYGNHLNQKSFN